MTTYSVIMAGGIGSRFWPMSTSEKPKQFHDVLGLGESLIQMTFNRLKKISGPEKIIVVTSQEYVSLVKEQLTEIPFENILAEPGRKNTAPCIALAAKFIEEKEKGNANMIVAPADHLILNETEFLRVVNVGLQNCTDSNICTIGITPSRPDTGYGYIEYQSDSSSETQTVLQFKEKPDLETAKKYISKGTFAWNSGIFMWTLNSIKNQFSNNLPEMYNLFWDDFSWSNVNSIYNTCESISIDFGVMEKAEDVLVIPAEFGWSDLGTWGSLYTHIELDKNNNANIGNNINVYDSSSNLIKSDNDKKVIVTKGLNDFIVVDSDSALLIIPKEEEQSIKTILADLKEIGTIN